MMHKKIGIGYSMGQMFFEESKLFPKFMSQLMKDGERTGTLDSKMIILSDLYKARLENRVDWIFKMITPIYLIITLVISGFFICTHFSTLYGKFTYNHSFDNK